MSERSGRCLCGAVSFTLAKDPVVTRICWCKDCQHLSANGTVNLLVTADSLSITGEIAEFTKQADSGNQITRQFCPACGVHLFAKVDVRPQFRVVRAGNLDNTSSIKPDMNIWTSSAPDWACFDMTLEQSERQAPPPKPVQS
jgi:hypothetical protein